MYNKVIIVGRISSVIDYRKATEDGRSSFAKFQVAVNSSYSRKTEDRQVAFVPIVAWRHHADFVYKYLAKGCQLLVEGRLTTNRFTSSKGYIVEKLEVDAERVDSLETRQINEWRRTNNVKELEEVTVMSSVNFKEDPLELPSKIKVNEKEEVKGTETKEKNPADFGTFQGTANDFLKSIINADKQIQKTEEANKQQEEEKEKNQTNNNTNNSGSKLISEKIISSGKKDAKVENIVKFVWNDDDDKKKDS